MICLLNRALNLVLTVRIEKERKATLRERDVVEPNARERRGHRNPHRHWRDCRTSLLPSRSPLSHRREPWLSAPPSELFLHFVAVCVLGAATKNLFGMLVRWLFVGTGLGLGPPAVALYVTEVSPAFVWGTNGALIQIATCLGILGALLIGIPVKEISGWWQVCFGASTIPAGILALEMVFCAESPHWLYKEVRIPTLEIKKFMKLINLDQAEVQGSQSVNWKNKERTYLSFINCQSRAFQELRATMKSVKNEVLKTKRNYLEDFKYF
ncbi:hypothetical protein S83_035148, partial [Arachis hypogaea]